MDKGFVGKVALVTGATNGISVATAVRLAAEGALVGVFPVGLLWAKAFGAVVGKRGIRVNAIEPGWIVTNMSMPMFDDPAAVKYYEERIALSRPGQPEEWRLPSPSCSRMTPAT